MWAGFQNIQYYVNSEAYCSTNGAMMLETTYRKMSYHWLADSSSDWHKTGFDISCKLSLKEKETICMNCKTLFSGKIRKIFQNVFR